MATTPARQWHRLFGIALADLFSDTPWRVELEVELALQSQFLDVAIIHRTGAGRSAIDPGTGLPDGLEDLRPYNLLTFKSMHETINVWALNELIGHYVTYRKLIRTKGGLPHETDFGLYAVSVRLPRKLCNTITVNETAIPGVFDIPWFDRHIRLVVLGDIERHPRNAAWELFSANTKRISAGAMDYRAKRAGVLPLLRTLFLAYKLGLSTMPYTIEQFMEEASQQVLTPEEEREFLNWLPPEVVRREVPLEDILRVMTPEERLRGLAPEERIKGLAPEERVKGLAPEERVKGLAPEERVKGLAPEERVKGLAPEERVKGLDPEERVRGLAPEERVIGLSTEEIQRLKEYLNRLN